MDIGPKLPTRVSVLFKADGSPVRTRRNLEKLDRLADRLADCTVDTVNGAAAAVLSEKMRVAAHLPPCINQDVQDMIIIAGRNFRTKLSEMRHHETTAQTLEAYNKLSPEEIMAMHGLSESPQPAKALNTILRRAKTTRVAADIAAKNFRWAGRAGSR